MSTLQEKEHTVTYSKSSESDLATESEEKKRDSKAQLSTTGFISYMNCVGVGMPFLTYNLNVNKQFLKRHNLKLGEVYTMNTPSRAILVDAIREFGDQLLETPVTSGGVGLDVARIAQSLLPQSKTVAYLGVRALDEEAHIMRNLCKHTRVAVRMEELEGSRTGVLLVAHIKKMCCEIFFIDNMACISVSYIDRPIVTKMLERSNIVYITGLSVLMNPKVTLMVSYYAFSRFKHCILILHREQFVQSSRDTLYQILANVDIFFLTPKCATAMIEAYDIPCCSNCRSTWDIFLWLKGFAKKSSVVVVTDGLETAYVHTDLNVGMSARYKSRYFSKCKAVDYYGSARAFVGGFMAMMIRGYQIDPCVECGFFCASIIIGSIGVQVPENDELMNQWYTLLEQILEQKNGQQTVKKRESSMPFTMFQTPWKERDVNAMFGVKVFTSMTALK